MSELKKINEERNHKIKELQDNCPHKETQVILVKWGENDEGHGDFSDGLQCSYCGKILKRLSNTYNPICLHEYESARLLGKTGDIYRCKKCGKEIDMTEDDDF